MATFQRFKQFNSPPPIIIPTQQIFHSACDNWGVEGHLSWQLNGTLESHAYTARNGDIYQIVPYNRRAQANYTANRRPDGTGALSMESGSDIPAEEPWTDAQLRAMIEWGRERCSEFPTIARRRCRNANDPGIGFHTMWGAPSPWTPVAKTCPGPERKRQFESILLPGIIKDAPVVIVTPGIPTQPQPKPVEDDDMYHLYVPSAGPDKNAVWCCAPGLYEPLTNPEQLDVLLKSGMAHPVKQISQREHDVLRDCVRRYSSLTGTYIDSKVVPNSKPSAAEMLAFTNKAAEETWRVKITSLEDGQRYEVWEYIASLDKRVLEIQKRVRGDDPNVDSLQHIQMQVKAIEDRLLVGQPQDDRLTDIWRKLEEIKTSIDELEGDVDPKP